MTRVRQMMGVEKEEVLSSSRHSLRIFKAEGWELRLTGNEIPKKDP